MTAVLDQAAGLGPLLILLGAWCVVSAASIAAWASLRTHEKRRDAARAECNRRTLAYLSDPVEQALAQQSAQTMRGQR